jgi:hypothetical protein
LRASLLRSSLGLLCLGLMLPGEALAARKAAPPRPARTAVAQPAPQPLGPQTAWTAAESPNCNRVRRKLWQADEGWIVKTVTVCH